MVVAPNQAIILPGADLDGWTVKTPDSVNDHPDYQKWYRLVTQHYRAFIDQHGGEYREYQVSTAAAYACRTHNLCAGAPGVGKTIISAVMIAAIYAPSLSSRRPGSIQIAVPSILSASSRWLVDLNKIPALQGNVAILSSPKDLANPAPIWIYTHDFLKRRAPCRRKRSRSLVVYYLINHDRRPACLIVDEIHNCKSNTQRSYCLQLLRTRAKRCLGLSGTLSDGRFELLHHTIKLVYGSHWPFSSSNAFLKTYGVRDKVVSASVNTIDDDGNPPTRYLDRVPLATLPQYSKFLRQYVHRITFDDSRVLGCCKMPALETHTLTVQPSRHQQEAYAAALNRDYNRLQQLAMYGRSINDRAEALCILQPLLELVSQPVFAVAKWQQLRRLVKSSLAENRKIAIFTTRVESSRHLTALLQKLYPGRVVRLYATDTAVQPPKLREDERLQMLYDLQYNPHTAIGVLSIYLASESIDLTSVSVLVFWDIPWQVLKLSQAICRACRPGAVHPWVDVYYLTTHGLLDDYMLRIAQRKLSASRSLIDFAPEEVPQELNAISPFDVLSMSL